MLVMSIIRNVLVSTFIAVHGKSYYVLFVLFVPSLLALWSWPRYYGFVFIVVGFMKCNIVVLSFSCMRSKGDTYTDRFAVDNYIMMLALMADAFESPYHTCCAQ